MTQLYVCSFLPSHSDIICHELNTILLSHFRNESKVRVFTKSPYFKFSPGSYSPLSASESLPTSKKTHYFYLATDISFITLVVLLSFEQRGWCGLYYMTINSISLISISLRSSKVYGIVVYFVHMSLDFDNFLAATKLCLSHCLRSVKKYFSITCTTSMQLYQLRENEREYNSSATANVTLQGNISRSTSTLAFKLIFV